MGDRCITFDYSREGSGEVQVVVPGYGGELAYTLTILSNTLTDIAYPGDQNDEVGHVSFDYDYQDTSMIPASGRLSGITPLHLEGEVPVDYWQLDYHDEVVSEEHQYMEAYFYEDGDEPTIIYAGSEGKTYDADRVGVFSRVVDGVEERYHYTYDRGPLAIVAHDHYTLSVPHVYVWHNATSWQEVDITDPAGHVTRNVVSTTLNRLPVDSDSTLLDYGEDVLSDAPQWVYIEDTPVYRANTETDPTYTYDDATFAQWDDDQFSDIPLVNTSVITTKTEIAGGLVNIVRGYRGRPDGQILRRTVSERLSDGTLQELRAEDFAYDRIALEGGAKTTFYRLREKRVADFYTDPDSNRAYAVSAETYSYQDRNGHADAYGRPTAYAHYTLDRADTPQATWQKLYTSLTTPLAGESRWLVDESLMTEQWHADSQPGSIYHDRGFFRTLLASFDPVGRVKSLAKGVRDDGYGTLTSHYTYYTETRGLGNQDGDLWTTYQTLENGDSALECTAAHCTRGPKTLYTYRYGQVTQEEVESTGSDGSITLLTLVTRVRDNALGLPSHDAYLDGTATDYAYDARGRLVQMTRNASDGGTLDVANRDYLDLGRTTIAWQSTDASVGIDAGLPRFDESDTTPGYYDEWRKSVVDGFGRVVREERLAYDAKNGNKVLKRHQVYDYADRIVEASAFNRSDSGSYVDTSAYDALGRVVRREDRHGSWVAYAYDQGAPHAVVRTVPISGGLSEWISTTNVLGQVIAVQEPSDETGNRSRVAYAYDFAGNLIQAEFETAIEGQERHFDYAANGSLVASTVPERGAIVYTQLGVYGPELWVDANGNEFESRYTEFGKPYQTIERKKEGVASDRTLSQIDYDQALRPSAQVSFDYPDDDGSQASVAETYGYDLGGRMDFLRTTVEEGDGLAAVFETSWRYDGRGRILRMTYPALVEFGGVPTSEGLHGFHTQYSRSGHLVKSERGDFEGDSLDFSAPDNTYDLAYTYSADWNYLQRLDYDGAYAAGYDPGLYAYWSETASGRLLNYYAWLPWQENGVNPKIASGDYSYDETGLITAIGSLDQVKSGGIYRKKSFDYDHLGRLSHLWYYQKLDPYARTRPVYQEDFAYDSFGNIDSASLVVFRDPLGARTVDFTPDEATNRLRAKSANTDASLYDVYGYDSNGNVTQIMMASPFATHTLTYDSRNQLTDYDITDDDDAAVTLSHYLYSPSGLRVAKTVTDSQSGTEETLYTLYDSMIPGAKPMEIYRRTASDAAPTRVDRLVYSPQGLAYHEQWRDGDLDAANSIAVIPDHSGVTHLGIHLLEKRWKAIEQLAYGGAWPDQLDAWKDVEADPSELWGESGEAADSLISSAFGGFHLEDTETGLDYMQMRYYGSEVSRFLSVDPKESFTAENPQSLNRYSYVLNNPVNFVDPTGMEGESCEDEASSVDGTGATVVILAPIEVTERLGDSTDGGDGAEQPQFPGLRETEGTLRRPFWGYKYTAPIFGGIKYAVETAAYMERSAAAIRRLTMTVSSFMPPYVQMAAEDMIRHELRNIDARLAEIQARGLRGGLAGLIYLGVDLGYERVTGRSMEEDMVRRNLYTAARPFMWIFDHAPKSADEGR